MHFLRLRERRALGKREYTSQATLAARPIQATSTSLEQESRGQGSSAIQNVSYSRSSSKATRVNPKAAKAARKALKETEESERRRKALAVLGKTSDFAAAIKATHTQEPTLLDLEQLRPKSLPNITLKYIYPEPSSRIHHWSPSDAVIERHGTAFQGHIDRLTQKFTRKQLLQLYKEGKRQIAGVQLGSPRPISSLKSRGDIAAEIVRRLWQWPYVKEVQERKAYLTETSQREFLISTSEFFLLLGPDGSSLLSLTERLKVTIKQVVRTEDAFSLIIEGPNYILDHLSIILNERKNAILSEIVSINAPDILKFAGRMSMRPDMLQRISKLSDALVEDKGNGMFQISAHHPHNIELATRLTTRASQQATYPPPPLLVHLPTMTDATPGMMFPHTYALFPFELPKATSLPWHWVFTRAMSSSSTVNYADNTEYPVFATPSLGGPSLFRARKVSEWLGQNTTVKMSQSHLKDGLGRILSSNGQASTLRDALGLLALDSPDRMSNIGCRTQITASTGHIVFDAALRIRNTLLPPLPGSWTFRNLLDWIETGKGRLAFIPSHPQTLLRSLRPNYRVMNQLVYRSLLPDARVTTRAVSPTQSAEPLRTIKIDISLHRVQDIHSLEEADSRLESDLQTVTSNSHKSQETRPSISAWNGVESFVNVMLPDRPMDMHLSLFDSQALPPDSELPGIRIYAANLTQHFNFPDALDTKSLGDPPLQLTYEGIRYVLDSNATIWRSTHDFTEVELPTKIVAEHVVDLESDQETMTCQARCTEPDASSAWHSFLEDCDRLTWLTGSELSPSLAAHEGIRYNKETY